MRSLKFAAILFFIFSGIFVFAATSSVTKGAIAPPPPSYTTKPNATPYNYPKPKTCYRCNPNGNFCESYTDTSPASSCSTGCGGCQPSSSGGGQQGGTNTTPPSSTPAPPVCSGSCFVLICSYSGRRLASGACSYGQNCCTSSQVVPVCAVGGDICGTEWGTKCCSGYSCTDTKSGFCQASGQPYNPDIATNPGIGCLHEGDCAINNTLCHVVNGGLMPDGGPCKAGTSPGSALTENVACQNAGGSCVNARSCSSLGLSTANNGNGCGTGVCCSKAGVTQKINEPQYIPPPETSPTCTTNGAQVVPGLPCCSKLTYSDSGKTYCGTAPAYIVDIVPGETCQRPNFAQSGIFQCRCNQSLVNAGQICFVDFGANSGKGRIRACASGQANCWEVNICDANNQCKWVNLADISAYMNDPDVVNALFIDGAQYGVSVIVVDADGTENAEILGVSLNGTEFTELYKAGRIKQESIDKLVALQGTNTATLTTLIREQLLDSDPTLTPTEKAIIDLAVQLKQNPYQLEGVLYSVATSQQGLKDWMDKTEAALTNPNLNIGTRALLLAYQALDAITLGQVSFTQQAWYNYVQCNAEANVGLRPQGCFGEALTLGFSSVSLADLAGSPFGVSQKAADQLSKFWAAVRAGDWNAARAAISTTYDYIYTYLSGASSAGSGILAVKIQTTVTGVASTIGGTTSNGEIKTAIIIIDPSIDTNLTSLVEGGIKYIKGATNDVKDKVLEKVVALYQYFNKALPGEVRPNIVEVSDGELVVKVNPDYTGPALVDPAAIRDELLVVNEGVVKVGDVCAVGGSTCAEQSLVASVILDNEGVDNGVVMILDSSGQPTHAVVEIQAETGKFFYDPRTGTILSKADFDALLAKSGFTVSGYIKDPTQKVILP